jgi:AraC-like DNA-binding protein
VTGELHFSMLEFERPTLGRLVRSPWAMSYGQDCALPGMIVPDAHVEFVLQMGAPASTTVAGHQFPRPTPRAMIYAQRHGVLTLGSTGANEMVAFRTTPAVATIILRHSLEGCWDRAIDLTELIGAEAHTLLDRLATVRPNARLALLESWLIGRLADWGSEEDLQHRLQHELLWRTCAETVGALAEDLGFTERTLRRRLATYAGISPKQLAMSGRILRASALLCDRPDIRIAEVALMTGFGDQSAFTNAFRAYLKLTPAELRAEPVVFLERAH